MSFTHIMQYTYNYLQDGVSQGKKTISDSQSVGAENNIDESITDGSDDLVAYTLDISQCKCFEIWSEGCDMTVKTNSSGAPDDTLSLVDGEPIAWSAGAPGSPAIPLSADITALYVTNSGTGTLKVRAGVDPTV